MTEPNRRTFVRAASAFMDAIAAPVFGTLGGTVRLGPVGLIAVTTRGRRSGQPRTVLLSHYSRADDGYVVIGTHGASRRQPAWYYNISADPRVTVTADGRTRPMLAHIIDNPERRHLLRRYALRGYGIPALIISNALVDTRTVPIVSLRTPS
ncbi:nitroreductase family deazaflavin-dependent oxidoreductase [Nocardia sp. NPDC052566]|uniref:nitroreductase family deazaflavin-dependent oxidoreductase n=1 Tax=Nocardia sp. NPDC052566 TaxID=3364330 RepID=UPI0037C6F769